MMNSAKRNLGPVGWIFKNCCRIEHNLLWGRWNKFFLLPVTRESFVSVIFSVSIYFWTWFRGNFSFIIYHPVQWLIFFYLTSVIFYITVIANHSNHRLVIWLILANSSGLALSSYFSNSKLNYCCFWYYTSSFERIVSYILFSSYVCTSTFNYPWQILKQYQYNFSGLLQLS